MKVAVVGCGGIAAVHAGVLRQLDGVEQVGFADIRPERAERFAAQYGGRAYTDYRQMLEAERPQALHICTPHYLHVPMALEALGRGVHVLMEKPPAIGEAQMQDLRAAAAAAGARLGICFQNRYNPGFVEAQALLRSGEAGALQGARAFVTWRRDAPYYTDSGWRGSRATEGGGVLINQSIHTLDLLCRLCGRPESVRATTANRHLSGVIEVEDTAEAYIRFPGCTALFYATTAFCCDRPVLLEAVCEGAVIRLEDAAAEITFADGRVRRIAAEAADTGGKRCWGNSHGRLIADFYRCVQEGTPFACDLASTEDTFALLMAIFRSAEAGGVQERCAR